MRTTLDSEDDVRAAAMVRSRLAELGITEADVAGAVAWARQE